MYYLMSTPTENGNYGNPQGQPFPGCISLPDEFLTAYISARGFVNFTVCDNAIDTLTVNKTALDAYIADHPDTPAPPPTPTTEERIEALETAAAQADETAIELYENQLAAEETNAAQDEALIQLYEMIGG